MLKVEKNAAGSYAATKCINKSISVRAHCKAEKKRETVCLFSCGSSLLNAEKIAIENNIHGRLNYLTKDNKFYRLGIS